MENVEVAILGGGVAGLSAAKTARDAGLQATVFEAEAAPGGLLANFEVDGFRFDHAVHLSFATEPEVRAVFDQTEYITHKPEPMCWDEGHWLRHPIQNNMHPLSTDERVSMISGLVSREDREVENYGDWLLYQYGQPIAERWPMRYTRKYWRCEADKLGIDWIGNRMRRPQLEEVLRGAFQNDDTNTYYVKEMRYPAQGGYFEFIKPLLQGCDLRCDHRATAIDMDARKITFANGQVIKFRQLLATIPLPDLVGIIADVPATITTAVKTLMATHIDLISVGFSRPDVSPYLWFYIYDEDIEAARAYSPSIKSPCNAPAGKSSMQFEIYSHPNDEPANRDPDYPKENTVKALSRMGLCDPEDICLLHHKHVPHGNVIFDLGMEERRDTVREWLMEKGIHLAGRFGEWAYLWSNQAFMSGHDAALNLQGKAKSPNSGARR